MLYYRHVAILAIIVRYASSYYINCTLDDGSRHHTMPYIQCQWYYSCKSEKVEYYYNCPNGAIFNRELNKCSTGGSCYEMVCAGRRDGVYPDPTEDCERYFSCSGGYIKTIYSCPTDHIFSIDRCVPKDSAVCEPFEAAFCFHKRDLCEFNEDGYHPIADCSAYIICKNGVEQELIECPLGFKFNGTVCTNEENIICNNFCTNKTDGYHYSPDSDCQKYINCKRENIYEQLRCSAGTVFNGEQCVIETSFKCPQVNKCKNLIDGYYSDYSKSCKNYFLCKNQKTNQELSCKNEQVWNGKNCVPHEEFHCKEPEFSIDCLGKSDFYIDINNCSNYFYCNYGIKTSFSCQKDLVFNGTYCVNSNEFKCPKYSSNSCDDKQDGYYIDTESNCQSYYYCAKQVKQVYVCPVDQIYNGKECVEKFNYTCPFSSNECEDLTDGYHRSIYSDNEFIYCENSKKLNTFNCKLKEIFDGEKCINMKNITNICRQKRKGYITKDNCQTYYLCKEYVIAEVNTCEEKYVFNGKQCVPNHKYICPDNDCTNLTDGFYQDYQSDCHKYFYCINGYKTTLTCPPGRIHNGSICVPEQTYTCQSKQNSNSNII